MKTSIISTDTQSLASRHKSFEKEYETLIPYDKHIVVRIDGHKFSKFTKGFDKPFDTLLSETMEETTKVLIEEFNAVTGYTQSDEITLIIPPTYKEIQTKSLVDCDGFELYKPEILNNQILGGRTQKMVSLISGKTTQVFNKIFSQKLEEFKTCNLFDAYIKKDKTIVKRIEFLTKKSGEAWFDARVYGVDTPEETFNSVMWRVRDSIKNSKAMFAQSYCSHKSLLKKNSDEQIQFCLENTGKDWNSIEDKFKYGILIKRESYEKEVPEEFKGKAEKETTIRTRIVSFSLPMTTFTPEDVDLINRKYK